MENYEQIVLKTNTHRSYYKPSKQIDGSNMRKYKRIIPPVVSGNGIIMEVDDNQIDVYWENPTGLEEWLQLFLG